MADFTERFNIAIRSPQFQGLDDDQKKLFVNRLFDEDERTAALDLNQRSQLLGRFVQENAPPPESTFAQDFAESPFVNMMIPGAKQTIDPEGKIGGLLNTLSGVPFAGPMATEFVGGTANAAAGGLSALHNAARFVAGPGVTAESPEQESKGWIDDLGLGTQVVNALAATAPSAKDGVSTHEDIKFFEEGGLRRAADWLGGGVGQTAGYIAPAMAFSVLTGGSSFIPFAAILTGEQVGENVEEGAGYGDPAINAISGATQAVVERMFGPESAVGRNIFREGIRKAMDGSAARMATRFAAHGVGEAATEGLQEYINQQVGEWSAGDKGWWNNLEPEDKLAVKEGIVLGGVIGGMFSVPDVMSRAPAQDKASFMYETLAALKSLTPEERGATGAVETPRAVRQPTEQEENDLRVDMAPEFLTDEQTAEWVKGTLDPGQFTEEQQAELAAATEEINKQLQPVEDPNVAPVERGQETDVEQAGLDEVVALATVKQQNLADEGDTEGAAQIQEAIDTLEIVRPKSEELATIKGFAEQFGARVNFFRATNSEALGSNGISVGTNGDIFIRWDASFPQAVSAIALHEVVHVVGNNDTEALTTLYETLKTYDPKWVAEAESWLRTKYAENGLTLDDKTMMHEVSAYMAQSRAHEVFAALRMAAHNHDFGKEPGPIKRIIDSMKDVVRRAMRAIPKHADIFGPVLNEEFDVKNRRAHEQMLGQFVSFLKTGETGRRPLDIQPDNFGRRGRKTLKTEAAPEPAPRRPDILEDETPPRTPRIVEDKGKRAGKRKPLDIEKVPPPEAREPRISLDETKSDSYDGGNGQVLLTPNTIPGEGPWRLTALTVDGEPTYHESFDNYEQAKEKFDKYVAQVKRLEKQQIKTPSKPAEVKLGKKPVEAVRAPRTPRILMDEPIVRTTAARLEVGDQLEVDNELVSVTRAEPKGKKRVIHYVNQDGDVSKVTVAPNKRYMKFAEPQKAAPEKKKPTKKKQPWEMTADEFIDQAIEKGDYWGNDERKPVKIIKRTPKGVRWSDDHFTPFRDRRGYIKLALLNDHYRAVRKAMEEGKPVPAEVLKDYSEDIAQQKRNVEKMEKEESAIEDAKFSLVVEPLSKAPGSKDKMFKGLSSENQDKMHRILDETGVWGTLHDNIDVLLLSDDSGPRGFALVRERYRDSEYNDREAYVEYIESTYDANGDMIYDEQKKLNSLGVRNVMEGRRELAKLFPKAIWAGGLRVSGARAEAGVPEYTRIPMYDKRARNTGKGLPKWWKKEMISEGSLSQEFLDERHRFDPEGRPVESETSGTQLDRTAPLDPPNYYSFSDAPGHFPPGHTSQTPLYNLHQVNPLSGIDPQSGPSWGLPDASWKSRLITKFQDKFYRVSELQKEIEKRHGSIHEDMDAYLHEMLYHGRAADRVGAFEKEFVNPLVDFIRKNDIDVGEFENWLHARHAPERNAHLDEIWEKRKRKILQDEIEQIENEIAYAEAQDIDTTILKRRVYRRKKALAALKENIHHAGMSNDTAASILEAAGTKFDSVAKLFDSMMDQKLKILLDAGLMTQEQFKKISIYKHYVPLKGKEYKGDLEEILEDAGIHTGQGFDIRGDEIGFSFGRVGDNKHTQPILAQAVVDIEEAIVRAEKKEVGKAFVNLVTEFPNPDLYKKYTVKKRRVWDAKTGTVRLVDDAFANRADNVIAVKDGEKTHYIEIFDARLASSMKNLGSKPMNQAVKLLARLNRFMAAVNTTYNPEFILTNLIRDVQTAGFNLSTEELKDIQMATMKGIPFAANGIRKAEGLTKQSESEVAKDEWVKYYREYVEDGGKIGFFGYTDVHEKAKSIHRKIKRAGRSPTNMTFTLMQQIGDLVSSSNSAVENAARLSAYVAARNKGVSRKRAAALGRNLTVNFNKKGDAGQTMNALYLFANASIQGAFRMGKALKSKRVQKMVGAQIMASFAMAAANRGLGGEDEEDGMLWWDKIGDWQKERNFIVMLDDGKHVKIPLPYGYNVFHVLGTELEAMSHATMTGTMTPERAVRAGLNMFNAIMTAFNPLGGASLDTKWQSFRFVVPSAFAPLADTLVNETYYGAPIHPVRSSWDYSPDSQRYFRSATTASKELTAFLNRWTGGSEYESGWWDQNPENLDYLVGAYAGAGPKTVLRGIVDAKWALEALRGEDTSKYEANDIAFLRRVYGEVNDNTVAGVYYENIEGLSQGEKAYKNLEGQQLRDWKEDNAWKIPLFKKLSQAQKGIRDTDDPDAKNRIRKRFNKSYREAWLSQFD